MKSLLYSKMKTLWRGIYFTHRWAGIALGILVLLWFVSGLVMVFVARPALTQAEQLASLPLLDADSVRVTPLSAWKSLNRPGWPERVRLNASGGRPLFHFLDTASDEPRWFSVHADNGAAFAPPDENALRRAVSLYIGKAAGDDVGKAGETPEMPITAFVSLDYDQWTVTSHFNAWRPLVRVELEDGRQYYVSTRTGEVVLDTTRAERAWNWLGSFAHWLYFTQLRHDHPEAWRTLILWSAFAASVMALAGVYLGIDRLRISKPYPGGRFSPYREKWKLWHHVSGIAGSVFLLAWLISGWLSLSPMGWAKAGALTEAERQWFAGGILDAEALDWRPPLSLLEGKAREVQWTRFDTQPTVLFFEGEIPKRGVFDGHTTDGHTTLAAATSTTALATSAPRIEKSLSLEAIVARAQGLMPQSQLIAAQWLNEADTYYYPRAHRDLRLPVARLRFDDEEETTYYIDPATGGIVSKIDRGARWQRWLYRGLHRFDFPPFDRHESARRVLVTVASLLGIFLSISGCVLSWKRLRR
jgi:uncharacterized iron-regulated membrane protein